MNSVFSLWLTKLRYSFPFFNKVISYSKNINPGEDSWFKGEKSCCGDFSSHYWRSDNLYKKASDYLKKVRETERQPTPLLIKILIFAIFAIEAWGFSYVFAGYAIPGASPKVQEYGGLGIAVFIAIILSVLTHEVGKEWYINHKLRELAKLKGHNNFSLENKEVTIDDTYSDDEYPEHAKLHNRIGVGLETKYIYTIGTTIFITIIAIGAIYVRQEALEEQIRILQMTAEIPMLQDEIDKMRSAGWATFTVLSVVFMFLQLIGSIFGNKWGFVGKESEKAYGITHKFHTSQDFEHHRELWNKNVAELGEKYLSEIQRAIESRIQREVAGADPKQNKALRLMPEKTFNRYINSVQDGKGFYSVETKESESKNKPNSNNDFFSSKNQKSSDINKNDMQNTEQKSKPKDNFFDSLGS